MPEPRQPNEVGPLLTGDQPLPHNLEAEVAVLGAMLLDPGTAVDAAEVRLDFPGSFYSPAHQTIFDAMLALARDKVRSNIDVISLTDALEASGKLASAGGRAYLTQVMNSVPSAANIERYVEIVHDYAVLRRLIQAGVDIVNRCFAQPASVKELVDRVETEVLGVSTLQRGTDAVAVGDVVYRAIGLLDRLHQKDPSTMGLQTGYEDLDRLVTGLRPGEMFVLAARPSIGKTALALNMATNIAMRDPAVPVGIFSLEMSTDLLVLRMLCSLARVNLAEIREGALPAGRWQEITDRGQFLRRAPIYIDDSGALDIAELRARARRMWREHRIQLLVIDYLQLLRPSTANRNATRENDVSQISGGIKALAKELNIPIIVLAQLNRQAEQERPRLSHLRESGAIEQDADVVALLHRDRELETADGYIEEGTDAELIVAKHRNGPTGVVPLTFLRTYTRFESRARISDADVP